MGAKNNMGDGPPRVHLLLCSDYNVGRWRVVAAHADLSQARLHKRRIEADGARYEKLTTRKERRAFRNRYDPQWLWDTVYQVVANVPLVRHVDEFLEHFPPPAPGRRR